MAGRSAIGKVLTCQPVAYTSATGFIRLANIALKTAESNKKFSIADIVACVFRLKDLPEIITALGVTAEKISEECGINKPIVDSALSKYRIQYNDAHKIWHYLLKIKNSSPGLQIAATAALNDREEDFIKTDIRSPLPLAIKANADAEFVYDWSNLSSAPLWGHHWAIEQ